MAEALQMAVNRLGWIACPRKLFPVVSCHGVVPEGAGIDRLCRWNGASLDSPPVIAVFTAGVVEETLVRAYTVTRLTQLAGSLWLAASISVTAFAALHIPVWGVGPSFAFVISGTVMMAFFVWKRDLLAMILAHIAIDAWAFTATPHFSQWWK
jgi:membrane protease YdiL (CAAX protease family)